MRTYFITDAELIAYIEGRLSRSERKFLYSRLRANNELELLATIERSYLALNKDMVDELLGEDTFYDEKSTARDSFTIAASNIDPTKDFK